MFVAIRGANPVTNAARPFLLAHRRSCAVFIAYYAAPSPAEAASPSFLAHARPLTVRHVGRDAIAIFRRASTRRRTRERTSTVISGSHAHARVEAAVPTRRAILRTFTVLLALRDASITRCMAQPLSSTGLRLFAAKLGEDTPAAFDPTDPTFSTALGLLTGSALRTTVPAVLALDCDALTLLFTKAGRATVSVGEHTFPSELAAAPHGSTLHGGSAHRVSVSFARRCSGTLTLNAADIHLIADARIDLVVEQRSDDQKAHEQQRGTMQPEPLASLREAPNLATCVDHGALYEAFVAEIKSTGSRRAALQAPGKNVPSIRAVIATTCASDSDRCSDSDSSSAFDSTSSAAR